MVVKYFTLETIDKLNKHQNAVFLFMGAGDVNKFQKAFESILQMGA